MPQTESRGSNGEYWVSKAQCTLLLNQKMTLIKIGGSNGEDWISKPQPTLLLN